MSTVITYRTNSFNIMVCDTRKTTFTDTENPNIDDSVLKMHYIDNYGFISSIGIGELAQYTFNNFKKSSHTPNDLLHSFRTAYDHIASKCDVGVLKSLNETGIIVSTQDQIIIMSNNIPTPRNFFSLETNSIRIEFPPDCDEEVKSSLKRKCKDLQVKTAFCALIPILEIFQSIAKNSKYVSSIACISIMGKNNNYPFFAQDEVENLLSELKRNKSITKNSFEEMKAKLLTW